MLPETARLFAPAKLTIELRVGLPRPDGLHPIEAEMVTLDLGDDLDIGPGHGVRYRGVWQGDASGNDLVARALRVLGQQRRVEVTKRIPAGAGLGGGSANAAAVLRAGGYRDLGGAAALGADVAYCLVGGRARVRGIGDIVEPLPHVDRSYTLLTPPVHCSTAAVYRMWDELGGPTGDHRNDLEPAAMVVAPELARSRDQLGDHAGTRPRLAGSGSTWFVEGEHPGPGYVVARTLDRGRTPS